MEQMVQRQSDLQGRISRSFENLKKLGSANITKGAVQTRLDGLNENWKKYEAQHEQLLALVTKETSTHDYYAKDAFGVTEEIFYTQKARFVDIMAQFVAKEREKSCPPTAGAEPSFKSRLSNIALPHFSGSYQSWAHFKDLFTSLVIKDASLSNVERMHYLLNALSGESAQILQGVPVTGENFSGAWKQLVSRYDNKRLLVNAQYNALVALKPMHADTAQELKRVFHGTQNVVNSLEALERPIGDGTDWLVHSTIERLSDDTLRKWESSLGGSTDPPSFDALKDFLENQIRTLEAIEAKTHRTQPRQTSKQTGQLPQKSARTHQITKGESNKARCYLCQGNHFILFCDALLSKPPAERKQIIMARELCTNCLGRHNISDCHSEKRCQKCLAKHHTILHDTNRSHTSSELRTSHGVELSKEGTHPVILATAQVLATTHQGEKLVIRALIDQGSEVSLMTENLAQLLRLPRRAANMVIAGVGASKQQRVRGKMELTISSRLEPSFGVPVTALILPQLTSYQPQVDPTQVSWPHISGLDLADPNFESRERLDLILGADVFCNIIQEGLRKDGPNAPIAQKTILGWILSGKINSPHCPMGTGPLRTSTQHSWDTDLLPLVQRFWEQEELTAAPVTLSADEIHCEEHFVATHCRTSNGRYMVRLPVKDNIPHFGNSKALATKLQVAMERRFLRDPNFAGLYKAFLKEYEGLGHMEETDSRNTEETAVEYFLPHHGVLKENSTTTKLRVVFNGSQVTSVGHSLNNFLCPGPNLLPELSEVLLRWRMHRYVFSADIEKMYRQILVHPDDCALQQIVWRADSRERLRTFQLKTVTYGLTCAPFLAIRTLQQLATDEEQVYPLGAAILRADCYVDDILSGDASIVKAKQRQTELIDLCKTGGFTLRKWAANAKELTPNDDQDELSDKLLTWPNEEGRLILGITWRPKEDAFTYHVTASDLQYPLTKRIILSRIAKLFDPLGWISPIVISAKIFMQSLWLLALDWDTPLPPKEQRQWEKLYGELPLISQITIPRWIHLDVEEAIIELHGFADASERAKAAVVYVRVISATSQVITSLITSKTKVASLKPECIARKELCAAKMLTDLVEQARRVLNLEKVPIHLWSDSRVALAWIQGYPRKWTQYVANRVAAIQTLLPQAMWHHIEGSLNPADCASRGLTPAQLIDFPLWWHGPPQLSATAAPWENSNAFEETEQEIRKTVATVTCHPDSEVWSLLCQFSSLTKLVRVTAWCQRWVRKARNKETTSPNLTPIELNRARLFWIATVQRATYNKDIEQLHRGSNVTPRSNIGKLNPLLDKEGILRVGGRLKHSLLSYEEKHPIILPPDSQLTRLIIDHAHQKTLHGGVQLMLGMLRRSYWIPRGRSLIKSWIRECAQCARWRATTADQQMGNLPATRVTPSRPFLHAGLDYAGPIQLRTTKGRGHKSYKGYIAIFVCFSTKAMHLEVVSDYTAAGFLAAFQRFVSRRGICATLTSDCGSNFVGAATELRTLFGSATRENKQLAATLANDGTEWRFNPPAAPHFGGLWEAAVKSTKFHLRRVIGDTTLTYEEMTTFLTRVEACLNSRPLQPLTDDPDDVMALTPAHFLIGAPLCAVPEPSLTDVPTSRLTRWQLLRQMQEHFWNRWAREYLQTLQPRGKWAATKTSVKVGDLCLIKSEVLPPTKWPLARIVHTHSGDDNLTRVVTLKTAKTTLKRPITKIIPLTFSN